jgi:hypothetical protein
MITEKDYLDAKRVVQEYESQIKSDFKPITKNDKKFYAIYKAICKLSPIYKSEKDEYIKDFFETLIGAGVFYLDSSKKLFSGFISEGSKVTNCVKEHKYPRKMTGKILLENPPSNVKELIDLYYSEYGCYNYVTSSENAKLRPFQKKDVFISPEDSYEKAGITLVKL